MEGLLNNIIEAFEEVLDGANIKDGVDQTTIESNEPHLETEDSETVNELDIDNYNPELVKPKDIDSLMEDDIGLKEDTGEFDDPEFINKVRENNENMDTVMSNSEEVLRNNPSDLEIQREDRKLEIYKGTIFENELKEVLGDKFNEMEKTQKIVETEFGETKPDIVLKDAKQDINIGQLEIKKGEDLGIEAKCGSAEYIKNEMSHILKQVEGHEGNSLVIVTKDYERIDPSTRAAFERALKEKGSNIYVADIYANDIKIGINSSLRI